MEEVLFAPRAAFLPQLAQGWQLPFIVEPMIAHHGHYAVLLWRAVA